MVESLVATVRRMALPGSVRMGLLGARALITILIAQRFSATVLAQWFLFNSIARAVQVLVEGGLPEQVSRHASLNGARPAGLRRVVGRSLGAGTAVLIVAATVTSLPALNDVRSLVVVTVAVAVVRATGRVVGEVLRGLGHTSAAIVLDGTGDGLFVCMVIPFLPSVTSALHLFLISLAFAAAIGVAGGAWTARLATAGSTSARWSTDIVLTRGAQVGLSQSALWVAGAVGGGSAVNLYGIASRLAALIAMPLSLANQVWIRPLTLAVNQESGVTERAWLVRVLRGVGALTAVVVSVVVLARGPIITTLYGDEFVMAGAALAILAAGQLINAVTGPCILGLIYSGEPGRARSASLASLIVSLVGAFLLGPSLGATGVALGFALGIFVQNALASVALWRLTGVLLLAFGPRFAERAGAMGD